MVFCFESAMVSVIIVDDARRSDEGSRHKAGIALVVVTIVVSICVLLSPCIKCLILRRQGKSWRAAVREAVQSAAPAPTPRAAPQHARYLLPARRPPWKARIAQFLPHRRHSDAARADPEQPPPWPENPPTWALTSTRQDVVHAPPQAHVRRGSVTEARSAVEPGEWDPVPAYEGEAGRPPRYDEEA
ncbi:hypothetical protein PsYK624_050960 [Phanerochaete sordida]|uniref:Uncharacterized protein n=1 Tax=Phanerochaete sordida TaxID=48140 RepID=A0A9P3LCL7_9APHY|nr:hypothetical protein PsYK624_050960 [Phanerochaete sordida]